LFVAPRVVEDKQNLNINVLLLSYLQKIGLLKK